jgi:hypothetical protein
VKLPSAFKVLAVHAAAEAVAQHCDEKIITIGKAVIDRLEADGWCLVPPGGPEWDASVYGAQNDGDV